MYAVRRCLILELAGDAVLARRFSRLILELADDAVLAACLSRLILKLADDAVLARRFSRLILKLAGDTVLAVRRRAGRAGPTYGAAQPAPRRRNERSPPLLLNTGRLRTKVLLHRMLMRRLLRRWLLVCCALRVGQQRCDARLLHCA